MLRKFLNLKIVPQLITNKEAITCLIYTCTYMQEIVEPINHVDVSIDVLPNDFKLSFLFILLILSSPYSLLSSAALPVRTSVFIMGLIYLKIITSCIKQLNI